MNQKTGGWLALITILFSSSILMGQIKIGDNINSINENSLFELESTNRGLLLPRVSLVSSSQASPLKAHVEGMVVFNIAQTNDVSPGIYWNDGSKWNKSSANEGSAGADGKSAYQSWLDAGNTGTEGDFLSAIQGETGPMGPAGPPGADGPDGKSAYQSWLDAGNTGSETDFINSLESGSDGDAWGVTGEDMSSNIYRAGNVGIGTIAAPDFYKLEVNGKTKIESALIGDLVAANYASFGNASVPNLSSDYALSQGSNGRTLLNAANNQSIDFRIGNFTKAILDINGNFGINVNQGNTSHTLDVNGETRIRTINSGTSEDEVLVTDIDGVIKKIPQSTLGSDGDAWGTTGEDLTTNIVRNGKVSVQTDGSLNSVGLAAPRDTKAGFIEFTDPDGTRNGFIGWEPGKMYYAAEKDIHQFGGNSAQVGINAVPTARLDVNGNVRVRSLPTGATTDQVISADAEGYLRKINISNLADGDAWGVSGEDKASNIYRTGNVALGGIGAVTNAKLDIDATNDRTNSSTYSYNGDLALFTSSSISQLNKGLEIVHSNLSAGVGIGYEGIYATGSNNNLRLRLRSKGTGSIHLDFGTINSLIYNGSTFYPALDNTTNLGLIGKRFAAVYAANGTIQTSDRRLKKNIKSLKYGITDVMKLKPVTFDWKDDSKKNILGFVAQDLMQVVPDVVEGSEDTQYGVNYSELIPLLTKAIQDQQDQIDSLKKQNAELASALDNLTKKVDDQTNQRVITREATLSKE